MHTIKFKSSSIANASTAKHMTPEQYVSSILSINLLKKVCAHFVGTEGAYSIFRY